MSPDSLYRRFFNVKRGFTEREITYFLNIDFVDHVALVAVVREATGPVIVGGARYIVLKPEEAEVAFAVIDQYQGLGIGTALMRHVARIARSAGLGKLIADVLPGNDAMLKVFAKSGFLLTRKDECDVVHAVLQLDATRHHPELPAGS
jgi:GNAT superfamily N-acetyltransferase